MSETTTPPTIPDPEAPLGESHTNYNQLTSFKEKLKKIGIPLMMVLLIVGVGLTVYQVQRTQNAGSRASSSDNQQPIGYFDGIDTNRWVAYGWALDPDTETQSIQVHLYIDNPAGEGVFVGSATADKQRSDLSKVNHSTNHGFEIPIPEKFRTGYRKLYAYGIDAQRGTNPVLKNSTNTNLDYQTFGSKPNADTQISANVDGSPLIIKTTNRLAGAIDSLTWKGKEFVDSYDHGRQIQGAVFLGQGGCTNPTEAGSATDGRGNNTTSIPQLINASTNHLATQIQMAYWYKAGEKVKANGSGCDTYFPNGIPPYKLDLSSWIMKKDVTIGFQNNPHIIDYKTTIISPVDLTAGIHTEAPTAYMPYEFATFLTYDPQNKKLTSLNPIPNAEQQFPVILATSDRQYALGFYSPQLPQEGYAPHGVGYGIFDIKESNVVKSNCVFRQGTTQKLTDYNYQCFMLVGTVKNVTDAIDQLYTYFKTKPSNPPTSKEFYLKSIGISPNRNPWSFYVTGDFLTQANGPFSISIYYKKKLWRSDIPTIIKDKFISFSLPTSTTNLGPDDCNRSAPCQVEIQVTQNATGITSDQTSINLPPAVTTNALFSIQKVEVVKTFSPWVLSVAGPNLNADFVPFTATLSHAGVVWADNLPVTGSSFLSISLPSNTGPSNCNATTTCDIELVLTHKVTGKKTNSFTVTLPALNQ